MKFSIQVLTLAYSSLIILFKSVPSNCHCDGTNFIEMTAHIDESFKRYIRKFCENSNNRSPFIINLRNEAMKTIPERILRRNETEILDLRDNRLTNLPRDLANLTKLAYIDIGGNQITDISYVSVVNKLPRLESLILSRNPLSSLQGLRVKCLLTLEAEYCEIEDIDDLFPESLPSLTSLNLTGNPLGTVHKLMSKNLTDLVLKNCQLTDLPHDAFAGLSNLLYLDLRSNKLTTMPHEIFSHNRNLLHLSLSNNTLQTIKHEWFIEKRNLRILNLSENAITSFNMMIFDDLSALVDLDLGNNKLIALPKLRTTAINVNLTGNCIENQGLWDLTNMARLRSLDLSHNRFNDDCDKFASTSLRILDLAYNNMTNITKASFSGLPNLTDLNLKANQFRKPIDPLIFEDNKILVDIELKDNPWKCNCTLLYPLYFYLTIGQRTITTSLLCDSPKWSRGKTWWDVCMNEWKKIMINEDTVDDSKTWIIAISSAFAACLIFGTIIYIIYTIKKNRTGRNS